MTFAFTTAPATLGLTSYKLSICRAPIRAIKCLPQATTARPSGKTKHSDDYLPSKSLSKELTSPRSNFSWTEQWYAVALTIDVPAGKPFAFTLFDTPLVLFRSSTDKFTVLEDRCSHRLAPLSEGRVVQKGNCAEIECPYHGWQFNGAGECTLVPQNDTGAKPPRAASVRSYPTAEALGAIWVWTGAPANADTATIPVLSLGLSDKVTVLSLTRHIPITYENAVENLIDYNHVFFAHHGVTDWKRTDSRVGVGGDVQKAPEGAPPGSFDVDWVHTRYKLRLPSTVAICGESASGFGTAVTMFAVSPAGHRNTRLVIWLLADRSNRLVRTVLGIQPRWMTHTASNTITDGDIILLRGVERELNDERLWRDKFGPPAGKGDQPVFAFRKFMDQHRDSMPWRQPPPAIEAEENLTRAEIMDRFNTHTLNCTACSGALIGWRRVKAASYAGVIIASALLLGLAASAATAQPGVIDVGALWKVAVGDCLAIFALLALWKVSCGFEEEMTYTETSRRLYES